MCAIVTLSLKATYLLTYLLTMLKCTYVVAGIVVLDGGGRRVGAAVRLQTDEVRSTPLRLEVDASVEPAHGHHRQVERRHRRPDGQVRVGREELDVALVPRHFSLTLHTRYITIGLFGPIPWGHSGPVCHALSLSSSSWTSMRRRRATVPLATSGEWA